MTPRKGESRQDFRARVNAAARDRLARSFQEVRRSYGRDGTLIATVEVPERAPYEPLPAGTLARRSTLVDAEGNIIQAWQIEKPEVRAAEAYLRTVAEELQSKIFRVEPTEPPATLAADLLALYPVGDHHLGMYAWAKETGAAYDLEIGEELLSKAGAALINLVPPCEQALIELLGDFQHYDGMVPETPAHHNKLDADTRAQRMIRVAIRSAVRLVDAALARHGKVSVIVEGGNHDRYSMGWLREMLRWYYEKEPRVTIDTSPADYHYFEFGACLIGTHHGDKAKMGELPLIMAADQAEAWGRTKFRYWHTGHVHNSTKLMAVANQDFKNVSTESFRILPPADAWAAGEGYRAIRDMKALLLHRNWGEVGRFTVNPHMWGLT